MTRRSILSATALLEGESKESLAEMVCDLREQRAALVEALEHYATEYCEGFCWDAEGDAVFSDCGGCKARVALKLARGEKP